MVNVRFAIKFATKKDNGVINTTISVILPSMDIINPSVPRIVITPENSWVNPIKRPSEN